MSNYLDIRYLDQLINDVNPVVRRVTATQIINYIISGQANNDEIRELIPILGRIACDADAKVVDNLAAAISSSEVFSENILYDMILENPSLSILIMENHPSLSEEVAIRVIKYGTLSQIVALSRRIDLSDAVIKWLLKLERDEVFIAVLKNKDIKISAECFDIIMANYRYFPGVRELLLVRGDMPPMLAIEFVSVIGDYLADWLGCNRNNWYVLEQEEAAVRNIASNCDYDSASKLVEYLFNTERLNTSLVFVACCHGNIIFIAEVFALLSGKHVSEVYNIFASLNMRSIYSLFMKTMLPEASFPLIFNAILLYQQLDNCENYSLVFGYSMIEFILRNEAKFSITQQLFMLQIINKFSEVEVASLSQQAIDNCIDISSNISGEELADDIHKAA